MTGDGGAGDGGLATLAGLRLGFVTGRAASPDGEAVWADIGLGRVIDALHALCPRFTAAISRAPVRSAMHSHRLAVGRGDVLMLPPMTSLVNGIAKDPLCRPVLREVERRSDVVIIQLPFPAPTALLGGRTPRVYHVCADVRAVVETSPYYHGARGLLAVTVARAIDRLYRYLAARPDTAVVSHGRELQERMGGRRGRWLVSSSIHEREIMSVRRSRPARAPFRVLFVGELRPEKGADTLLEAFGGLLDELPDAELHVVGTPPVTERGVTGAIVAGTAALRARGGTVEFLGHRDFGPALFQCFADADVLAVPSRSEGTPRVLIEARAFGCPVVASRVGGIPSSIEDGVDGLLVPPGDAGALRGALLAVARDGALRGRLVEAGLTRARSCTVEGMARILADEAAGLVRGRLV
jgi:glycosyltransferase involved in cell wall biosynthesis